MITQSFLTKVWTAAAVSACLALTGCGTRLSDTRLVAGAGGTNGVVTDDGGSGLVQPGGSQASGTGGTADGGVTASTTGRRRSVTSTTGGHPAGTGTTGATVSGPSTPIAAGAACTGSLAPLLLGQTLGASGLVGAAIGNLRLGLQLWAKDVNSRGGVQCHPVQLTSLDDGSDPARVSSNFNDLVNGKHVVAMLALGDPIADAAVQSSAERLKVPVIGGDLTSPIWTSSRYIFPQGSAAIPTFAGALKQAAASKHAKRAGNLYCQEASICGVLHQNWSYLTSKANVAMGISKAISITQSDYTAECQALKDDHDDVVFAAMDGSALSRLARSCAALNYFPPIATENLGINAQVAQDPNIQRNTAWLGAANIPFPSNDTPGAKAFHAAADRFLPGQDLDQSTVSGWASGKLLEAALAKVASEARKGPVTTALILKALGLVKNETLDGLAAPISFTAGKPAPVVSCYFPLLVGPGGFSAPSGGKRFCL